MTFHKDLSKLGWDKVKERQLQRLPLIDEWIRITGMKKGQSVLDIGPGPGAFVRKYVEAVGENGAVYVIEKSLEAIEYLRKETENLEPTLKIYHLDAEKGFPNIEDVTIILITDVLHHADSPASILRNIHNQPFITESLILISEFDPESDGKIGPPLENRLSQDYLIGLVLDEGFEIVSKGKQAYEHYFFVFRR